MKKLKAKILPLDAFKNLGIFLFSRFHFRRKRAFVEIPQMNRLVFDNYQ